MGAATMGEARQRRKCLISLLSRSVGEPTTPPRRSRCSAGPRTNGKLKRTAREGSIARGPRHLAQVQGIRSEAAEGIRTLDLLHGNYASLRQPPCENKPICRGFTDGAKKPSAVDVRGCVPIPRFGHFRLEVPEIIEAGLNPVSAKK
jgi:hypothetical protein